MKLYPPLLLFCLTATLGFAQKSYEAGKWLWQGPHIYSLVPHFLSNEKLAYPTPNDHRSDVKNIDPDTIFSICLDPYEFGPDLRIDSTRHYWGEAKFDYSLLKYPYCYAQLTAYKQVKTVFFDVTRIQYQYQFTDKMFDTIAAWINATPSVQDVYVTSSIQEHTPDSSVHTSHLYFLGLIKKRIHLTVYIGKHSFSQQVFEREFEKYPLEQVSELYISNESVAGEKLTFPASKRLVQLEKLTISYEMNFPENMNGLRNLKQLSYWPNCRTQSRADSILPAAFNRLGSIKQLEYLMVAPGADYQIPEFKNGLTQLKMLAFYGNCLNTSVPKCFTGFKQLQYLNLGVCYYTSVSPLEKLPLRTLASPTLSYSDSICRSLSRIKTLRYLSTNANVEQCQLLRVKSLADDPNEVIVNANGFVGYINKTDLCLPNMSDPVYWVVRE